MKKNQVAKYSYITGMILLGLLAVSLATQQVPWTDMLNALYYNTKNLTDIMNSDGSGNLVVANNLTVGADLHVQNITATSRICDSSGCIGSGGAGGSVSGEFPAAAFSYVDADTITAGTGGYFLYGTGAVYWTSPLTIDFAGLAADTWYYIYLDDSAISGPGEITSAEITYSSAAPLWDDSKLNWYNGNDKAIFAVYTDGSGNIREFAQGGDLVVYASAISLGGVSSTSYTDVQLRIPAFSTEGEVLFTVIGESCNNNWALWRTNGASETGGKQVTYSYDFTQNIADNNHNTLSVVTDSSGLIEVRAGASCGGTAMAQVGWRLPPALSSPVASGDAGAGDGDTLADLSCSDSQIARYNQGAGAWECADQSTGAMPVAAVQSFATASCPAGWLAADGSDVGRAAYSDLFTAIGTMYGSGDGSTTFTLPDYRGYFLRGLDNGAANDPDSATRLDRGDGTAGDAVGTKQDDAFESHYHSYTAGEDKDVSSGGTKARDNDWGGSSHNTGSTGTSTETRPKNIYVLYCIKT